MNFGREASISVSIIDCILFCTCTIQFHSPIDKVLLYRCLYCLCSFCLSSILYFRKLNSFPRKLDVTSNIVRTLVVLIILLIIALSLSFLLLIFLIKIIMNMSSIIIAIMIMIIIIKLLNLRK